jgi:hypothetical protein
MPDEAGLVDSTQLIQGDLPSNATATRLGYRRLAVVMGATMTVRIWRFISSGDTITQKWDLRIFEPRVGSRETSQTSKRLGRCAEGAAVVEPIRTALAIQSEHV